MPNSRIIKLWELTGWGNDMYFMDYAKGTMAGHLTPLPKVGDVVHSKMQSGRIGAFEVTEVRRCGDPPDMFFATVKVLDYVD